MLIQAIPPTHYPAPVQAVVQPAARPAQLKQPAQPTQTLPSRDHLRLSVNSNPVLRTPNALFGAAPVIPTPVQGISTGVVTLDLLSLNVFGLPKPLGKNITERSAVIGSTLGRYDIAGLQETFSKDTREIGKMMALNGTNYQSHKPKHRRLINSGLEIFSKHPILTRDFKPFRYGTDSDALAGKGVAFVRVQVPGVGPVDIYDTHYQANNDKPMPWYKKAAKKVSSMVMPGYDKSHEEIRLHDNQVLGELMKKHDQGYPTFVMGDFNTVETSEVYRDIVTRLGLTDSFRELNPTAPGFTSDGPANPIKKSNSQKRIDFIFYRPGKDIDVKAVMSQVAYNKPGEFVSDHFGVHTRFELVKKQ